MSKSIQFRRGNTQEHLVFTGLEGEITIDTNKNTAVIHNGSIAGGISLAREDLSNIPMQKIIDKGIAKSDMANVELNDIASKGIAKQDLSNVELASIVSHGIMKTDSSNATHLASQTEQGPTQFATTEETLAETIDNKTLSPLTGSQLVHKYKALPTNYISGFEITKASNRSFKISTGVARSSDDQSDIRLTSEITKNISTNWESGDNLGCLETGNSLAANTQYYIYIIKNSITTDVIIKNSNTLDLSTSITASDGYTHYRIIGQFITDSNSNIIETEIIYFAISKNNIFSIATPNYNQAIFKATNVWHTATEDGYLWIVSRYIKGFDTILNIESINVRVALSPANISSVSSSCLPIKKGQKYTMNGNDLLFIPIK